VPGLERWAARAAFLVGLAYGALSVYWGLGGVWLLDTVSGALAQEVRSGTAGIALVAAAWGGATLKLIAAVLPLLAARTESELAATAQTWHPWFRRMAWLEAAILISYGLVLTAVGLLVQSGLLAAAPDADRRALAWHAFLWDPWFLVWGLLVALALQLTRERGLHGP